MSLKRSFCLTLLIVQGHGHNQICQPCAEGSKAAFFFLFSANKSGHDRAGSTLLLEMTSRRKYKVTGFTSCDG